MSFTRGNTRASKLSATDVAEIRDKYNRGSTQGALARAYKVSIGQIGRIVRGESWGDLTSEVPASRAATNTQLLTDEELTAKMAASTERVQRLLAEASAKRAEDDSRDADLTNLLGEPK